MYWAARLAHGCAAARTVAEVSGPAVVAHPGKGSVSVMVVLVEHPRWWRRLGAVGAVLGLCSVLLVGAPRMRAYAVATGLPADASCAALAASDPSASNGGEWGMTLLRGHGAPGGWFGVDVCGNGINSGSPGGANLSCDRVPADLAKTGCAPGHATYDGFGLSFQCVELVVRFAAWAFGDAPRHWVGNAPDLWLGAGHPADFVALRNGGAQAPVAGDVLVWGALNARGQPWPAGPQGAHDGHVAVIASVQASSVTIVEQNALWGQQNRASETLPLAQAGGRWFIGGPALPSAAAARGLYGWLHSALNSGRFSGAGAVRGAPISATAQSPTGADTSSGVPSVAGGVVVTQQGTLADLVWEQPDTGSADSADVLAAKVPAVRVRDLGAPPGTSLPSQTPAVHVAASGTRTVYVVGADGQLYAATTAPNGSATTWRALGAPGSTRLRAPVVAAQLPDTVAVAAVGSDRQVWWRAGLPDHPGGWAALGRPANTQIVGAPVLAGSPGSGQPFVLVLGADGALYESDWGYAAPGAAVNATASPWNGWQALPLPPIAAQLAGPLLPVLDRPSSHAIVGQWADVPVNVLVRDRAGALWWLRRTAEEPGWSARAIATSGPVSQMLGGVAVAPASSADRGSIALHVYIAQAQTVELERLVLTQKGNSATPGWTPLAPLPADAVGAPTVVDATDGDAVALALGADESALIMARGRQVVAAGEPDARGELSGTAPLTTATTAVPSWLVLPDATPNGGQPAGGTDGDSSAVPQHPGGTTYPAA